MEPTKKAALIDYMASIGWQLCRHEPTPDNDPHYWDNLGKHKVRYYVAPVHAPNGFQATLRDTENEALQDLP